MDLPRSPNLHIDKLAAVFNKTTNTYKYYWFLALLDRLPYHSSEISISDLAVTMISKVWYSVNYFRLSFGKQDKLADAVETVRDTLGCEQDIDQEQLKETIKDNLDHMKINKAVQELGRYVPYRFLRPWFSGELKGMPDHRINKATEEMSARDFMNDSNPPPRYAHGLPRPRQPRRLNPRRHPLGRLRQSPNRRKPKRKKRRRPR